MIAAKELSPAVQYLVTAAVESTAVELAWELESFDGPCAIVILQEALDAADPVLARPANLALLRRRISKLQGKAAR